MAVQLFKLAITATTTTNAKPSIDNFFTTFTSDITNTEIVILASKFQTNTGGDVGSKALVTTTSSKGYYLLYVEGVLQESALYTVTSAEVTLNAPTAMTIVEDTPLALSVVQFEPSSATTLYY